MTDFSGLILLLLPMAAATGWFAARRSPPEEQEPAAINPDYVRGISHLVNDDTDKAVEVFMGLLEADSETVELHLALGSLFRRRGEVDRALRIHQNLVMRPNLKPVHRNQARFELGRDYLKAGIYDRAEELFSELANQGMFLDASLTNLASIYEHERDWEKAIEMARWLGSARGIDPGSTIAHYHCEIACRLRLANDAEGAGQQLRKALSADPDCVRASLIEAELQRAAGRPRDAIAAYRRIADQDPSFVPEILAPLGALYAELEDGQGWFEELRRLADRHAGPAPQIALAALRAERGEEALQPLLDHLATAPSWLGFHAALAMPWPARDDGAMDDALARVLAAMHQALDEVIRKGPRYQCRHCGYVARVLNWQCPSCRHWNTTQPLDDLSHKAIMVGDVISTIAGS